MSRWVEHLYDRSPRPIQELLVEIQGIRLFWRRFGADFDARLRRAMEDDFTPAAELVERQRRALRSVVRHAATSVPHYRATFTRLGIDPVRIRCVDDLRHLPVLRRRDVQDLGSRLWAEDVSAWRTHVESTTGTTGSPVHILWTRAMARWNQLTHTRARAWAGFSRKDSMASFLGHRVVSADQRRPPYWRRSKCLRRTFHSSFHLDEDQTEFHLAELRRSRVSWIEAYPSTAWLLALGLAQAGKTLPLRAVFVSSEPILPIQRDLIEDRFACRVWDAYSMSEGVLFAAECEIHDGLHAFPDYGVIEVLDERDRPVPPGSTGRIVATGLQNRAMPLLRYDTGDVGGWMTDPCPCGRTLPRLLPITTKAESYVVRPDGTPISPSILTHAFKPFSAIRESRIRQTRAEEITVSVVAGSEFSASNTEHLRDLLAARIGRSVTITIERVESLPPERGGKRHWVTSTVPLRAGLPNIHTKP